MASRQARATLRSHDAKSELLQMAFSVGEAALAQSNEAVGFASGGRRRNRSSTELS